LLSRSGGRFSGRTSSALFSMTRSSIDQFYDPHRRPKFANLPPSLRSRLPGNRTGSDDDALSSQPKEKVSYGRSWRASELRLKSFEDLHKLWFVLVKERDMLLTEVERAGGRRSMINNPERIDKVRVSMARLKTVINERSRIYKEMQREIIENEFKKRELRKQERNRKPDSTPTTPSNTNSVEVNSSD